MALTTTTYATYTAVLTMLPNLPQAATATTEAYTSTAELICRHLERAYNLINTKLAKRFSVPFALATKPPMCQSLNEDLACYYSMRSLYTRDAQNNSEWVVEHYDKAMEILNLLATNGAEALDLLDSNGALVGQRVAATSQIQTTTDYSTTFDLDDPPDWEIDSDRLNDIETGRDA